MWDLTSLESIILQPGDGQKDTSSTANGSQEIGHDGQHALIPVDPIIRLWRLVGLIQTSNFPTAISQNENKWSFETQLLTIL